MAWEFIRGVRPIFVLGLFLGFAGASACGGSEQGSGDGDATGDGDSGDGDGDVVGGDGDGDVGDGDSGDGDGDNGDGDGDGDLMVPDPPGSCQERGQDLPARSGETIFVAPAGPGLVTALGGETTLRAVIANAAEGDTILLEDGTYTFDEAGDAPYTGIYVTTPNITIRGASGDASAVVLDSNYADHGMQTAVISVDAPGVVLADFTVQESIFHLIHLWENGDLAIIHNVTLQDGGQQFLKASPGSGTVDRVEVSCSRFLMTEGGRDNVWGYGESDGYTRCYTGGIDTHNARDWHVHDSYFEGIYCDTDPGRPAHGKKGDDRDNQTYAGGLSEHAIHMWDSEEGSLHTIERNHIVDCARGIGIGLQAEVFHTIIRNNIVQSSFPASSEHDVGIIVERGVEMIVAHNTVFSSHPDAYPNSIEIRWGESNGVIVQGNLTSGAVSLRDGAMAHEVDNVAGATASLFVDAASGDFHLSSCDDATIVEANPLIVEDFDLNPRGSSPHAGAYQCE